MIDYFSKKFVPYIPPSEYDKVAQEFLEQFFPEGLKYPVPVPIGNIAKTGLGLDNQYICLSEELDIYGMTIFTDGNVEVYDPDERLYSTKFFKAKTVLIDPEAVKKTTLGCLLPTSVYIGTSTGTITKCKILPSQDMQNSASATLTNCQ